MKICPVCQAVAFDDAAVCYGCLHRFGENEGPAVQASPSLPSFKIKFTPEMGAAGTVNWTCVVEHA